MRCNSLAKKGAGDEEKKQGNREGWQSQRELTVN